MMSTKNSLADRIYQAQCYDSVEPIEYMTPYPNLGTLIVGQNIKLANKIWYLPQMLSYADLLQRINQTANWLEQSGITNHDRVYLANCPTPEAEILAHAIWLVGGSVVIGSNLQQILGCCQPKLIIGKSTADVGGVDIIPIGEEENQFPKVSEKYPPEYHSKHKALLSDEALVFWNGHRGIRLSHYNLLINSNGTLSQLVPDQDTTMRIKLPAATTAWAVLQAILPIYAGIGMSPDEGDLGIGIEKSKATDYYLNYDLKSTLVDDLQIHILPEATAVLKIGDRPIQLTKIAVTGDGKIIVSGHSVMMGYTDNIINEQSFTEAGLELPL